MYNEGEVALIHITYQRYLLQQYDKVMGDVDEARLLAAAAE